MERGIKRRFAEKHEVAMHWRAGNQLNDKYGNH